MRRNEDQPHTAEFTVAAETSARARTDFLGKNYIHLFAAHLLFVVTEVIFLCGFAFLVYPPTFHTRRQL